MWQKSRAIWKYIDRHYKNDYDWFVLGGDDIFLIVENLRKVKVVVYWQAGRVQYARNSAGKSAGLDNRTAHRAGLRIASSHRTD